MKKNLFLTLLALCLCLTACGGKQPDAVYRIGVCGYAEHASQRQILDSFRDRLARTAAEHNVLFDIHYENADADPAAIARIVKEFMTEKVDLMAGVTTPVALQMRDATADNPVPVVFAAVSDPEGALLVASNDAPGGNLTGTSDPLDTAALFGLVFAAVPDASKIGLLYDPNQDASVLPVMEAKRLLRERGVEIVERTGSSVDEIILAAQALAADGVDAVFTPTDNSVMRAERSIYQIFRDAGIPHFAGADAFALNGAFSGYGVDYESLGVETADMVSEILLHGADPSEMPVRVMENGNAVVNRDTCAALGWDLNAVLDTLAPLCDRVRDIATAELFTPPAG